MEGRLVFCLLATAMATTSGAAWAAASNTAGKSAEFPEKGRPITLIVPWPAGGSADVAARLLAASMETDLGVPIQVVNRGAAGGQVGMTSIAKSKPDGYTIGYSNVESGSLLYLNPERAAVYSLKDLQPLARHTVEPVGISVKGDGPYKTMQDLVKAAKDTPRKIKMSTPGKLNSSHLGILEIEKVTGAKFLAVHFAGGTPAMTAIMGGHVDAYIGALGVSAPYTKSGQIRVIGVAGTEEVKYLPGVKTIQAQGINYVSYVTRGMMMPAGAPKDVVQRLNQAAKKAMDNPEHHKRMEETGAEVRYLGPDEFRAYWVQVEKRFDPLLQQALKEEDAAK